MKGENFSEERNAFETCLADARDYIYKITVLREIDPEKISITHVSGEIDLAANACESALDKYMRIRECIAEEMGSELGPLSGKIEKKALNKLYKSVNDLHKSGVELESEFLGFWMHAKKDIEVMVNKIAMQSYEASYSIMAKAAMDGADASIKRAAGVFLRYDIRGFPRETDPGIFEAD
jgi:hypothetical protein